MKKALRGGVIFVIRKVDEFAQALTTIGTLAAVAAMIGVTYLLWVLTVTQLNVAVGAPSAFKSHADTALGWLGIDVVKLRTDQYVGVLSSVIGSVAVLVTLWFSVTTTVNYFRQRSALSRSAVIRKEAVELDGTDDLEIMLKYFKHADAVTVFSGDFSWLKINHELLRHVRRLAAEEKISFVSYKPRETVRRAAGEELFELLERFFRFEPSCRLKCSLVTINQSRVFLYKVDRTIEGGGRSVCVVSSKDDARYLLETLDVLCGRYAGAT